MIPIILPLLFSLAVGEQCYWNRECPNLLYSTKTPYDTIRGDIRDYPDPPNCEAISIWSLHRHGNRNPGSSAVTMKALLDVVQDQVIASYDAGRSQLCAQDVEAFRTWTWNDTIIASQSYLTGTGYEELYGIAKRLCLRYPHLLRGSEDDYYFRPTNSQRTIASATGFIHGLTDGTALNLTFDEPREHDEVIRPYTNCSRYLQEIKGGSLLEQELEDYANTEEYLAVLQAVQDRLGIAYQLTRDDLYTLYEICRYHRTWVPSKQDAWCALFTDEDLEVLEYRDDVGHYYRNGYGSWVNPRLAGPILQDLRERFHDAALGDGKNIISYFSHNAMTEMTFAALGLFKDPFPIVGSKRVPERLWRTSFIAAFSTNLIAVLNRCSESGTQTHRVQFFINERVTDLCPLSGCSWEQFQDMLEGFEDNLDFCNLDYPEPEQPVIENTAVAVLGSSLIVISALISSWI